MCIEFSPAAQRGISFIELIIFIVLVSIALVAILSVTNQVSAHNADPLVHKQALAIAESLLEEVELMPLTICDPDDPNAATAVTAANCTGGANGVNDESRLPLGPEGALSVGGAEGRYAAPGFDNVSDYGGFAMNAGNGGIRNVAGTVITELGSYAATVVVSASGIPAAGASAAIPPAAALGITVTVTGPDNLPVVLEGYRTRFSPNGLP